MPGDPDARDVRGAAPRTLVDKILDRHRVDAAGDRSLVYVDRLILADTALAILKSLRERGLRVARPDQVLLIPDHFTASAGPTLADVADDERRDLIRKTQDAARALGIPVIAVGDPRRGIQHIVSTEQAYAQPGITLAAVDSHTSTQGAVGALAFSVGSDLAHVLATQCAWLAPLRPMQVELEGRLRPGVTAKDVALALIARVGATGASGFAVEFAGSFVRSLGIQGRMTLCNLAVEMGSRLSIVAPDDVTYQWLSGRPLAPRGADWDRALAFWKGLPGDPGAFFERTITLDVASVEPMVTWGNNAENAIPISGRVPDPAMEALPERRAQMENSLAYMGLAPSSPMAGLAIDQVFIGSCANATLEDLRVAAALLRGRKVAVPTLVVPGSGVVRAQAEAEGLGGIFRQAGATWGEAGCSMCVSMNGDAVAPGARCASTSNRNHRGRQGPGSRTHLVSPPMAAAAAVLGRLCDVRELAEA